MMPLTNPRRPRTVFSACLTLGIALSAIPTLAGQPAAPAPRVSHWQKLPLCHVVPGDVLAALKWDKPTNLPAGVSRLYALQSANCLLVDATPAGFAQVAEIVKRMDVAPRQVQVKFALAAATSADLKESGLPDPTLLGSPSAVDAVAVTGGAAERLLATLTERGAVVQAPTCTTTNNVEAVIAIAGDSPVLTGGDSLRFDVTPRINSDNTITLNLKPSLTQGVAGTPQTVTRQSQSLRTVKSGDTLLLLNPFLGAAGKKGTTFLLFVTPTILSEGSGAAAK